MGKKNTLREFVNHQRTAAEELGKALVSLLPAGFREHGANAVKQSTQGFKVVADAATEEVKKGVDKVKRTSSQPDASQTKVEVEVQ